MAVKDGRLLEGQLGRGPFACFETPLEQGSRASKQAQKRTASSGEKHPSPRLNSMALKDGRLLEGPPGRGPFAGLEHLRTRFKGQPKGSSTFEKAPFATP